jgi:hypothetical protein
MNRALRLFAGVAVMTLSHGVVVAQDLSFTNDGLAINAGSMGEFTLDYPAFESDHGTPPKIVQKTAAGSTATVTYDGGAILTASIGTDKSVHYAFTQLPAGAARVHSVMLIGFAYQQGGKWSMDGSTAVPFPIDKPTKPHLFGDHAKKFELTNYEGKSLDITFPDYSWVELTDNREWNWPTYGLQYHRDLNPQDPQFTIQFAKGSAGNAADKPVALVDAFGQLKSADWPGKVKSEDELKADVSADETYYKSLTAPTRDKFGGLPDSGGKLGLHATGFFHVETMGDKSAMVDPDGNLDFQLGVCCCNPGDDFTTLTGRESAFEWIPSQDGGFASAYLPGQGKAVVSYYLANIIRKYGKPYTLDDLQQRMIERLRKFGFNSIGAFSQLSDTVLHAESFPYVAGLPLDRWTVGIQNIPGVNETWDPYDPANAAKMDAAFAKRLPARAGDPLLIGYFVVNEPAYEDVPKVVPGLKGSQNPCKHALAEMLRKKYATIAAFNSAWGAQLKSLDGLDDAPLAVTTREASQDVHDFTGQFFDTYFKLVSDTFHKYDSHHMLIGSRLQPGTINNEQLCRICGKYLDVMSFNYYTDAVDKDFLKRIHDWTGRPMLLSEFYWSAGKDSGLAGGREVKTQQDRGLAYRNYVGQSASLGFVVGIEWFTLIDQAATGRWFQGMSGERANSGLFSVADRPWKAALEEMKKTNDTIYDVELGKSAPYAFDDPQFAPAGNARKTANAPRATGPIALDGTTANWPGIPPEVVSGSHVVTGADSGGVEGTFKLCWDDKNLYVLASIVDPTPLHNSHQNVPADIWNGDAIELFLGSENLDQGGPLIFSDRHLCVGAGAAGVAPFFDSNVGAQYACATNLIPGGDGKSYTLEVAIPWTGLGVTPKPGEELLFDLAIDDDTGGRGRSRQITWNGTDKNSTDRTHWGRIKLAP